MLAMTPAQTGDTQMIPVAKSQMYQTAIAAIHTVQFQAGTYVNVRWQYRDGYGTDW